MALRSIDPQGGQKCAQCGNGASEHHPKMIAMPLAGGELLLHPPCALVLHFSLCDELRAFQKEERAVPRWVKVQA
jgi:hypothetical protein